MFISTCAVTKEQSHNRKDVGEIKCTEITCTGNHVQATVGITVTYTLVNLTVIPEAMCSFGQLRETKAWSQQTTEKDYLHDIVDCIAIKHQLASSWHCSQGSGKGLQVFVYLLGN